MSITVPTSSKKRGYCSCPNGEIFSASDYRRNVEGEPISNFKLYCAYNDFESRVFEGVEEEDGKGVHNP